MKVIQHVWLNPDTKQSLVTVRLPDNPADAAPEIVVSAYSVKPTELLTLAQFLHEAHQLIYSRLPMPAASKEAA